MTRGGTVGPVVAALVWAACSTSTSPEVGSTALVTVFPAAGAEGVALDIGVEVTFDAPLEAGSAYPIALQLGDCPGPVVAGVWSRTDDGTGLTFTPSEPLAPSTLYTIHVGGGLPDVRGARVDLDRHGPTLGGAWVTREMVMGMTMMGMSASHSGPEWQSPNGKYGLAFSFRGGRIRRFRGLPIGMRPVWIVLTVPRLGAGGTVRQAAVSFAPGQHHYTMRFARYVVELARHMTVAQHLDVSWNVVKDLMKEERRRFRQPRLRDLRLVAIDEISIGHGADRGALVLRLEDRPPKGHTGSNPIPSASSSITSRSPHECLRA